MAGPHTGEDLFPAEGPHVRRRSALSFLLAVALVAGLSALTGAPPASANASREARLLIKINNARADHGLPGLVASPDLTAAARSHTAAMAGRRSLFHTPTFSSLCCWSAISENVGFGVTLRQVHLRLMRSAAHRANILDPGMHEVGVAVVRRDGALWVTEVFQAPA